MSSDPAPPFPSGTLVEHMRASTEFQFHEVSGRRVHASMMLNADHHQPFGIVHGDVYAVGVNNSTDFVRPMVEGRVDVMRLFNRPRD